MSEIRSIAEEILAIEILEYHNKNHLSGDNKSRSEIKQSLLKRIIAKGDEYLIPPPAPPCAPTPARR